MLVHHSNELHTAAQHACNEFSVIEESDLLFNFVFTLYSNLEFHAINVIILGICYGELFIISEELVFSSGRSE